MCGRSGSLPAPTQWLRLLGTRWVVVMRDFTAFFDASGTDPAQAVVVVNGYVSTSREWKKFTKAWASTLRKYDLPYFHMTEFMSRRGSRLFPVARWPDDRKTALINELIPI